MKLGIIGIGNLGLDLLTSLAEKPHEIYVSDVDGDNIEVIKNSEVIFCCVNTEILPSNIYDIKNVMDVVEDFGVAFEEEVPLVDKIVVICSTVNPGDTKEISDILTQMNLRVCYLPLTLPIKNQEKIIVGSIDPYTVNIVGTLISDIQEKPTNIVSMTSKSAELCKLALNSYKAYKINFANMMGELLTNYGLTDEIKLVMDTLSKHSVIGEKNFDYGFGFGGPFLPADNRVFGEFCNRNKLEFVLPYVTEDFNLQHNQFLRKHYSKLNEDKSEPFIISGLGYKNNSELSIESSKLNLVYDLLRDGYIVHIIESEKFIRESKLPKELINDFNGNVKFFKQGTSPKGIYITL
jgi:UDP-glucose 6-dehydrogenase